MASAPTLPPDADVVISHDQFHTRGGAEVVAFEMAREFDAPIYAARIDDGVVPDDIEAHEIVDRRIGKWAMSSHYMVQDMFQMLRWQHVERLHEADVVIENKTNPWWYVPKDNQTVIRYCHSPPRGMFDQFHRDGGNLVGNAIKMGMRSLFKQTIPYADAWICNSDLVERRTHNYLGVSPDQTSVIYPPVPTEDYGPEHAGVDEEYYFTFSRLRSHKRIHEIVDAITQLGDGYRLVVGGEGPEREQLETRAGDNVEFVGYMSETEKRRRLAECKGFVFAAENEDFGIVPVEAMASGTPVLGVKEGFTQHQVVRNKNGRTWARKGGHLREAIRLFDREGVDWSPERIAQWADERFNADRFRTQLQTLVANAHQQARVDPWDVESPSLKPMDLDESVLPDGGGS